MASIPFNKTKIVATIGPASNTYEVLRDLIRAGVDVCRLNLSHGDYSVHQQVIETIRRINEELRVHTAILIDLQGPKLRIGQVENEPAMLVRGEELVFTSQECTGNAQQVYMNYRQFP
ncbi:MAG TPA: pyruvate kinase, partial [Bacteroidia bacterium]|nr:pyruvate kinase [Bacteroidia bacterium]